MSTLKPFSGELDDPASFTLSALAKLAPKFARLEGAGALDIRPIVTQAAEIAVNDTKRALEAVWATQQKILI